MPVFTSSHIASLRRATITGVHDGFIIGVWRRRQLRGRTRIRGKRGCRVCAVGSASKWKKHCRHCRYATLLPLSPSHIGWFGGHEMLVRARSLIHYEVRYEVRSECIGTVGDKPASPTALVYQCRPVSMRRRCVCATNLAVPSTCVPRALHSNVSVACHPLWENTPNYVKLV